MASTWQYAEWDLATDQAQKLIFLKRHIAEVSQRIMGTASRGASVTAVSQGYLDGLNSQKNTLEKRLEGRSYAVNFTTFRRG
jgi:hypothetical protein